MTLAIPLVTSDPNALPPNVFTRCGLVKYFRLQAIPAYIGTAFGKRSHIAPVGRRRSREARRTVRIHHHRLVHVSSQPRAQGFGTDFDNRNGGHDICFRHGRCAGI